MSIIEAIIDDAHQTETGQRLAPAVLRRIAAELTIAGYVAKSDGPDEWERREAAARVAA